jgi:uncharacterized protein (TIGR02284 family)
MQVTDQKSQVTNQKAIDTLNNLLEINNDRIEGYQRASRETNESDLKDLFVQLRETSYTCKQELIAEVKRLGGIPKEGTRTTGKLYRAWMDIKSALTKKDRKAILSSCETGEDVAVRNYEDALKNYPESDILNQLLVRQYSLIKADHDKVKSLRDSVVKS